MEPQGSIQPRLREVRPTDRQEIFEIREAVFGQPFEEEWRWKFETDSGSPAKVYVAEVNGSVAGLRPIIFERLKVLDEVWLAGRAVDFMVSPDFRRYGIASQMANETFAEMERSGISIMLGLPNESGFKVYSEKLSYWRHVCSIPFLVKPLNLKRIVQSSIKNPLLRALVTVSGRVALGTFFNGKVHKAQGFRVRQADGFDERFDALWEEVSHQYGILLVRDKAFLQWRFSEKPNVDYVVLVAEAEGKLLGYIVLREGQGQMFGIKGQGWKGPRSGLKIGFILDVLASDRDVAHVLVSEAIEHFNGHGVDAVGCLMLKTTPNFRVLKEAGFFVAPKRVLRREFYFGVQVRPSVLPDEIISRQENWYLTLADIDTI